MSSTTLELLAIKELFDSVAKNNETSNCFVVLLSDSLSALRLTLGLDERSDNLDILRSIDESRKITTQREIKEYFIHVRSHRNIAVPLNEQADYYAGSVAAARLNTINQDCKKCAQECTVKSPCSACAWNKEVNKFISQNYFTPLPIQIFQ